MTAPVDKTAEREYTIPDKAVIIADVKALAIALSKKYGCNIRIEADANGKMESAKVKVTEFL
jgi:hypothetical protein